MQRVTLTYDLAEAGWASATFAVDGRIVSFEPSYLSDAFGDLVRGVATIAEARETDPPVLTQQRVEWFGEPLGLDLLFEVQSDRNVQMQLVEMPDEFHRNTGRKVLFDDQIDLEFLAHNLCEQAIQIRQKYGVEGYREKWVRHEFPSNDLMRLEKCFPYRISP